MGTLQEGLPLGVQGGAATFLALLPSTPSFSWGLPRSPPVVAEGHFNSVGRETESTSSLVDAAGSGSGFEWLTLTS